MKGLFITFEGTEGGGKTTHIELLAQHLKKSDFTVQVFREPGGTPVGEEIRHTLKHSEANREMTAEAELLLMNASRAQLVRQAIRPALNRGEIVLCDRFYHSTLAYQGFGRGLDLAMVKMVIDVAVGETRPDLTFLLSIPLKISEERREKRWKGGPALRDRFEEADAQFFVRVEQGYNQLADAEPARFVSIDATQSVAAVQQHILNRVTNLLPPQRT